MFDCSLVETKLTTIYTVIQYIETVPHFNTQNNYSETYRPIRYWCQIFLVSEKYQLKKQISTNSRKHAQFDSAYHFTFI